MKLLILFLSLILFTACNSVYVHDGVVRTESGQSLVIDNINSLAADDLYMRVALGKVNNSYVVHKFGKANSVGTSWVTLCSSCTSLYSYLTSASKLNLTSTSASDTAAGIGARTVLVQGLNSTYDLIEENATLNGVTPVQTTNSFIRVFRMYVLTAGSNNGAVGTIDASVGAAVKSRIDLDTGISNGQTLMAMYTIPRDKVGLLTTKQSTIGSGKEADVQFVMRKFGGVFRVQEEVDLYQNIWDYHHPTPKVFCEKTDLEFRAVNGAPVSEVHAEFELIILDKSLVPDLCN